MLSREIEKDPTWAHKMAMIYSVAKALLKDQDLSLDSYFENASRSGSEASTQTCMSVLFMRVFYAK